MSRGPDAGVRLERALLASAALAGCTVSVDDAIWVRWASATFTGARHTVWLAAAADDPLETWLAGLAEAELPVRDHLVADLAVAGVVRRGAQARVTIEALTVEV